MRGGWKWYPSLPQEGKTVAYVLAPGRTADLRHDNRPVSASKVRLWVRTESGAKIEEFKDQDLWLVPEPGHRYFAPDVEPFTRVFTAEKEREGDRE